MNSDVSTGICVKVRSNVLWMGRVGRGGGHCAERCGDRAIQSRSALASSATWLLITSVSTRACLRPPLCLCTCRCRGCSGSRGDAEQSRPLSLSVSFHHVKKESQALLPKSGHFLKKSCLISRCKMFIALWFLILNRVFFFFIHL